MRLAHLACGVIATALGGTAAFPPAHAQDVKAGAPIDLSVTIYRAPYRDDGGFDLDNLDGFALITETRRVVIPAGEHRLRFEGVADGIEPVSAIVTGLPSDVIEKNRDAMLLSPSALIDAAAAQQGRVILARTSKATGKTTRSEGRIRSLAENGVVFETADGVEALRCSGLPETFSFDSAGTGLSSQPTLSVLTRTDTPIEAVVQLSYLARGFDWSADYAANMSSRPGEMDLGAWITLANGNGTSFPDARVQVVAGRLNHESDEIEPIGLGRPILAHCWPQGSTSDSPDPIDIEGVQDIAVAVTAITSELRDQIGLTTVQDYTNFAPGLSYSRAQQEDLGDLKLYRVPDRTTLSSRQAKQVRMIDVDAVPFARIYDAHFYASESEDFGPLDLILRTKNDKTNKLGIPLPSGRVTVFETATGALSGQRLLAGETSLRDIAIDEETELRLDGGSDIRARQVQESASVTRRQPALRPVPGVRPNRRASSDVSRIEVSNARPYSVQAEVRVYLDDGEDIAKADQTVYKKNGRPIFKVTIPASDTLTIRYQTFRQSP